MHFTLNIEYNSLKYNKEKSFYNHLYWDIIRDKINNITHIIEKYDDVTENPIFEVYSGDKFLFNGEGNAIQADDIGMGGIWLKIDLYNTIKIT